MPVLLVLVYINDIISETTVPVDYVVSEIKVPIKLSADDCIIYSRVADISNQSRLITILKMVMDWCKRWQMKKNNSCHDNTP